MGGGSWTTAAFTSYSASKGITCDATTGDFSYITDSTGKKKCTFDTQDLYKATTLHEKLNPRNVIRECLDTEEHPNTLPVILALDVTGSMGSAAVEVAKKLNRIMTSVYDKVKDVEFMIMGIGDVECDYHPIQISQFESDIRIAEQLDNVYFEFGGGGNSYESYTAAWYMGSRHTKLDCLARGRKGVIITMGDERLNPTLSRRGLNEATGDSNQEYVNTDQLYKEASEKFNIYHIDVDHRPRWDAGIADSWKILGDNFKVSDIDGISDVIYGIIVDEAGNQTLEPVSAGASVDGISW